MSFSIALNFEDGITRFIECRDGEKVLDAAFRQKINLPMDCADGVCGTCKCRCDSGAYELGGEYIDDALTEDEAASGLVLTCQMVPSSDCVVSVPMASTACKTAAAQLEATIVAVTPHSDAALEVEMEAAEAIPFLPGQYVNIDIPGSGQARSYSFSSCPGERRFSFLIKHVPGGLMSGYLDSAQAGDKVTLAGPMGSFYLREPSRPLLFLAGGTGLAPFLSMLRLLARQAPSQQVHLIYAVTRDEDLVLLQQLDELQASLPSFTYETVVSAASSNHARKGYVTDHLSADQLFGGDVDVYLCGPPPMVDAVRDHLASLGVSPANFHFERFTPNPAARPVIGHAA